MRILVMKLASTITISSSLIVAVVSLVSGAGWISIFIRSAVTLLVLTFLSLLMYRITLPPLPDASESLAEKADEGLRGTRIDLLAGDER